MDTGLAFSQEGGKAESFFRTAVIRSEHKKKLKPLAKNSLGSTEKYRLKLFACGIFMLTQDEIERIKEIVVDQEWQGKRGKIKSYLYNFYRNDTDLDIEEFPEVRVEEVHSLIEGTPVCHDLCYRAREGTIETDYSSNYNFLKGMILTSPGDGRKT